MRTLSANDVQKFVAGMLAYIGLQAVVQTAFLIVGPAETDSVAIIFTAIPSLALLIGIQMFMGKTHAMSWALVFLAVYIVLGLGAAIVAFLSSSRESPIRSYLFLSSGVHFLAPAIMLGALLWCRSKLLPDEPNA